MGIELQLRHLDVEPERDPPNVGTAGQDDETGAVAGRGRRRNREPQAQRGSRHERLRLWLELGAVRHRLRVDRDVPRRVPAPGVGGRELLRAREPAPDEPPAERGRVREDQRLVGANEVDPAASFAQHRDLAGVARGMHLVSRRGEGRLHLLHRPGRMALEEKRRTARDVGRSHARAVQQLEGVRGNRRQDVHTGGRHVGLQLERHRRRPARTRSRRCGRAAFRRRCPWSRRRPRSRPGRCPGSRSSRARRRRSRCRRRRPVRLRLPRRCRAPSRRCHGSAAPRARRWRG